MKSSWSIRLQFKRTEGNRMKIKLRTIKKNTLPPPPDYENLDPNGFPGVLNCKHESIEETKNNNDGQKSEFYYYEESNSKKCQNCCYYLKTTDRYRRPLPWKNWILRRVRCYDEEFIDIY